jgi:hypothetical protein
MLDLLGHFGYASIMFGMILLTYRHASGWIMKAAGDAAWLGIGFALGMSSIILWCLIFLGLDIIGWRKWRVKTGVRCISDSKSYDLGRGVLYTKRIGSDEWIERGTTMSFKVQLADDDDLDTLLLREEL